MRLANLGVTTTAGEVFSGEDSARLHARRAWDSWTDEDRETEANFGARHNQGERADALATVLGMHADCDTRGGACVACRQRGAR